MNLDRLVGIFGLLFAVAIVFRVYLVYRKTGQIPVILKSDDAAHDYIHKVLAGIFAMEGINILVFRSQALFGRADAGPEPALYAWLGPVQFLEKPAIMIAGLVLAYAGLAWSIAAQHQMGRDWRIGIDFENETRLVTGGVYRLSRHPIYLGFIIICVGLFFATPNVLTLLCAVLVSVVLSIEARLEEAFLLSIHGESYKHYLTHTRRWI